MVNPHDQITLSKARDIKPDARIGDVVDAGIAQRQRASDHLKALVRAGVLEEHRAHRDRIFLNRALIEALGAPVLRQAR
mgnify:CR=1 FL=1